MAGEKLTKEDQKWRAESDAHTLQEADLIRKDNNRLNKAVEAAQRLANEQMEKAKSMKKIGQRKTLATKGASKKKKGKTLATQ